MEVRKLTATSIFIVPTLKIDKQKLMDEEINFINGYIKDLRRVEQYDNVAYLLFKPKNIPKFNNFVEDEYDRTTTIIEDYDYEGGYVVLVYTLNPNFAKDFELVKQGNYSKTSKEFQNLFPKIVTAIIDKTYVNELSLQHQVFKKTDFLRAYWYERTGVALNKHMEVWTGFEEERETLDIEKIKELV